MSLSPGTRLGSYEVIALIGQGGMGEVYRAVDGNLKRSVAVKVLPDAVVTDPDRLARFQREAEVLAALNHPNIASIYGLERSGRMSALVMELVEGPTLADRIALGAIPIDESVSIAKQIADAVGAAHDQAIIHRDLKPANIKVRPDGTVKVLDFGLAKAMEPPAAADVSAPTITSPAMTQRGVILGTAAYMSPEQARGRTVDRRADVWAFGCVLFEMLTARRPFDGEDLPEILANVMKTEPDWTLLPAATPLAIRRLLRRALIKDHKRRLADISAVRLELEDADREEGERPSLSPSSERRWIWAAAAGVLVLASAAFAIREMRVPAPDVRVVRFDVTPSPGVITQVGQPLSPDGRTLAFASGIRGDSPIWVQPLDSGVARPLAGTEGASRFFWSPDSQEIAYFVEGSLKKVAVNGGRPQQVVAGPFRDGAWGSQGVMLVGGQRGRPLLRVSALGGTPTPETTLDESRGEISHDYPEFLPDGRHYIFLSRPLRGDDWITYVGTIGSKERRPLPGIRSAVKYSPTGHVLFLQGSTLMAQRFDRDRLELSGDAFPIAEQVSGARTGPFSVADNGGLAFLVLPPSDVQFTWFDRSGRPIRTVGEKAPYRNPSLSRDERFVAYDRGSPADVWVLDLERGGRSKVTSNSASDGVPVWSSTQQEIVFSSNRGGTNGLYRRAVGSDGDDQLLWKGELSMQPFDWSKDGRYVAYLSGGDLWALPLPKGGDPIQLTASPIHEESSATFSPDGRWIAYQSTEAVGVTQTGEGDVFIQSFPDRGFKKQVSTAGGFVPRWSSDGQELFYLSADGTMMAVAIQTTGSTIDVGTPAPLFPAVPVRPDVADYWVSRDGRFLIGVREPTRHIRVILNWHEELKRLASN